MVGRTPEYLGKKIEAREIKLAAIGALFVPTMVLVLTALAVVTKSGLESIYNPAAHGFSEALYAYDSQANNNGSAFAGYGATEFSALVGTIALWLGRLVPLIAALALGGALAAKKTHPVSAGTFRTDGWHVRRPARRDHHPHRRADDLPGAHARAGRGGAVVTQRRSPLRARGRRAHRRARARPAAGDDRVRAASSSRTSRTAAWSSATAGWSARSSSPRSSRARATSTSVPRRPVPTTTRRRRRSRTSARPTPTSPRMCARRRSR